MNYSPGAEAPTSGIYWCSVCKLPARFEKGEELPQCQNMCGRGRWQLVREDAEQEAVSSPSPKEE
jgi:hypothetical protein